jgi:acyl-CoA thioester hydrolase
MPFTHRLRVRYNECDPQNLVFNANFLAYADIAITELLREAFGSYTQMVETYGVDQVVAEARIRYLAPARFDDLVDITLTMTNLGTTSTTTRFEMARGDTLLVEGELRHVFVDTAGWAKTPIPDAVREALSAFGP